MDEVNKLGALGLFGFVCAVVLMFGCLDAVGENNNRTVGWAPPASVVLCLHVPMCVCVCVCNSFFEVVCMRKENCVQHKTTNNKASE